MKKYLTYLQTPFRYIGGIRALLLGLLLLVISAGLAHYTGFRFDGLIDFHAVYEQRYIYWLDRFVCWLLFALLVTILGGILKKRFRIIDVFGMTALAFSPALFQPVWVAVFNTKEVTLLLTENLTLNEMVAVSRNYVPQLLLSGILTLLSTIWLIVYLYQSFQVNLNLKKAQSILLFIIITLTVEVLSLLILRSY